MHGSGQGLDRHPPCSYRQGASKEVDRRTAALESFGELLQELDPGLSGACFGQNQNPAGRGLRHRAGGLVERRAQPDLLPQDFT